MKSLSLPFRIDVDGHVATTGQYAKVVEGQLLDVLATNHTERIMRPDYGADLQRALFDPVDDLVRSDAGRQVMARIQQWAPRVTMDTVRFNSDALKPGQVFVDVTFKAGALSEVLTIRVPVSAFLNEETPL